MYFADTYLPTTAADGLIAVLAWYTMIVAMFALLASVVFSWLTRTHVAPEHNTSRVLTSAVCLVAALSYYAMQEYFRMYLGSVEGPVSYEAHKKAFLAIGQLRYMDWAVTTPLLIIKMFMVVHAGPDKNARLLITAVVADLFMIVAGYIGEQQLDADGNILVTARLMWGAISTLGYLVVVYCLYRVYRDYYPAANRHEQRAFKWSALTVVTLWGVYPIGYILIAVTTVDPNWLHIAYSAADVVNKVGVGILVYLAGSEILEQRIDIRSREHALYVG